jgi:hypothetical protein
MKKNQVLSITAVVGASLACPALSVMANDETFTTDFGTVSSPLTVGGSAFPFSLTLPKFNSALGTLTGVDVTVRTTDYLSARLVNVGAATTFTGAEAMGTTGVAGLAGALSSVTLTTTPFDGDIGAGSFFSPALYLGPAVSGSGMGSSLVPFSGFGAYEANGGGSLDFSVDASFNGTSEGTAIPGVFFGSTASVLGSVSVDYTYVASAPEGGDLLTYGLICLGGMAGWACAFRPRVARGA